MSGTSQSELLQLLDSLRQKLTGPGPADPTDIVGAESSRYLSMLEDGLNKLAPRGKDDIFVSYLLGKLEHLAKVAADAANKSILTVSEHEFTSAASLVNAFGDGERVLRYTWRIDRSQSLFADEAWRRHFVLTSALAISGAIDVRTILIFAEDGLSDVANVRCLLDFFSSHKGLGAKTMSASEYAASATDDGIPAGCIEFGVYGERFLYKAQTYEPVSVGCWSTDAVDIALYRRFFDALWNTATVSTAASPQRKVRMSQLFAIDAGRAEREQNPVHESVEMLEERFKTSAA